MTTALDLFCGAAGGWSLGLHRVGVRTIAACELDGWRRATFAANNPGVRMYADVRELTADTLLRDLGFLPDWIVGSPPCQDASCANPNGRGVDGERTGLFFEAIRLVGECRPAWACFENVPGLRTRGADRVLAELEALGYACWPLVVGAVHAGAPHRRQRVWIVAADVQGDGRGLRWQGRSDSSDTREQQPALQGAAADTDQVRQPQPSRSKPEQRRRTGYGCEPDVGDTDSAGLAEREGIGSDACAGLPPAIRAVAEGSGWNGGADGLARGMRVDDGLSAGLARICISAYGDAVVPQITEAIARAILSRSAA